MDQEPRLLAWNYETAEMEALNAALQVVGAPRAVAIHRDQGDLTLRSIIHEGSRGNTDVESHEKVVLFYNIPSKGVFFLLNYFKEKDLPRPIYAVVTEHSIEWPFARLLEHLVEERDAVEREAQGREGS